MKIFVGQYERGQCLPSAEAQQSIICDFKLGPVCEQKGLLWGRGGAQSVCVGACVCVLTRLGSEGEAKGLLQLLY